MTNLGNKEVMSKNLKYYVAQSHKDRNQICNDLGISYSTFTDWYNGNKYPRIDSIELMANYFGIQKSDLIEERTSEEPEEILILNRAAKRMTPENRKKLLDMARLMFKEDFKEDD